MTWRRDYAGTQWIAFNVRGSNWDGCRRARDDRERTRRTACRRAIVHRVNGDREGLLRRGIRTAIERTAIVLGDNRHVCDTVGISGGCIRKCAVATDGWLRREDAR